MDDLLKDFLTESYEHLDMVDRQMVEFERNPSNAEILRNVFRLVHTIKGTCGFLGLPRLEALAHSAESLLGQLRDGAPVSAEAVTLILASIDRIKFILTSLEAAGAEPDGGDGDLITALDALAQAARAVPAPAAAPHQTLERPLKPGEASLDELERVFRETAGPDEMQPAPQAAPSQPPAPPAAPVPLPEGTGRPPGSDEAPESRLASQTIRVQVGTLEHLMTMVSELVLTRNQLVEIARREEDPRFKAPLQRLSHITAELQDGIMKTRMQPIGMAWSKLPRLIRDLSNELGKKVEIVMDGGETELDRQVLEQIRDPLTHMVRNSVDHGIEPPQERVAAGKPAMGRIRLSAGQESGFVTIRIADDGRGLDLPRIKRKALKVGIAPAAELDRMSDAQLGRLIFHPGLTTASRVTSVSGRGVGMDVVKANIDALGGTIDLTFEPGRGTIFVVKIPLTLAIVSALIVTAAGERFALPQTVVREVVRVRPGAPYAIERLSGATMIRLRERLLPVLSLAGALGHPEAEGDDGFVVVAEFGRQQFGILVEQVLQTEEIVVKPMSALLKGIPLYSGNTILGDGSVVLILDPNGLARHVGHLKRAEDAADAAAGPDDALGAPRQTVLVFRGGGGSLKAVPLALVTRLEEIEGSRIEWVGGRALVQYRGKLMPLVPANDGLQLKRSGVQPLVIVSDGERTMGLAVESIVDIIEERFEIEVANPGPGVLGSAVLGGRATEIVDLLHYLPLAYPDWLTSRPLRRSERPVLLVEPSQFIRDMLAPVLHAAGFEPTCCSDAASAAALLGAGSGPAFDAVILDVEHLRGQILTIAATLRADPRHAHAQLVGLASAPHPDIAVMAREAGLDALIGTFDRPALLAVLADKTAGKAAA